MDLTEVVLVILVATGFLMVTIYIAVQVVGAKLDLNMSDNARTRQSCEASAQRAERAERRVADRDAQTIELVRQMMSDTLERSA